jgi:hypothetical protein
VFGTFYVPRIEILYIGDKALAELSKKEQFSRQKKEQEQIQNLWCLQQTVDIQYF